MRYDFGQNFSDVLAKILVIFVTNQRFFVPKLLQIQAMKMRPKRDRKNEIFVCLIGMLQ